MVEKIYLYILTTVVFFGIDMTWIGVVARNFYRRELAGFLAEKPIWPAAITFYLLYIIGILILAVFPAVKNHNWVQALQYGALFGGLAYATYDLTNYSTLKGWPLSVTVIDIIWGIVLTSSVAVISYFMATKWFNL